MIVKKVANPLKSSSKATRIASLVDYIRTPESESATEKCIHAGARNFDARLPGAQTAEMIALAELGVRSRDPIEHYILSWREGEHPAPDQVEEAVDILLDEMGVKDHQVVYGLHADTDNTHLHVVINRVHPVPDIHPKTRELRFRVVKINRGFDREAAHRAGVRIEHAQHWRPDANKRYQVCGIDAHGKPVLERAPRGSDRQLQPGQQELDRERRIGRKSATRIAIETALPILEQAPAWQDVHARLARYAMRYEETERGALIRVGDQPVKASKLGRSATLAALEARLGPYEAADPDRTQRLRPRDAARLVRDADGWPRLHVALAERRTRYVLRGRGARIVGPGFDLKASEVSRLATIAALEKRLGQYQPPGPDALELLARPVPAPAAPAVDFADAVPLLLGAANWDEVHARLAERGMRYEKAGSGAHLVAGAHRKKVSDVSRKTTLGALQKRLGPFQPLAVDRPASPAPPVSPDDARLEEYLRERKAQEAARDEARLAEQRQAHADEEALRRQQENERARLLEHDWTRHGDALNAMRSVLAAEQAAQLAELREKRRRAREERRRRFPPWPTYEVWLRDRGQPNLAARWRHQSSPVPCFEGDRPVPAVPHDIRAYEARILGAHVQYRHRDTPDRVAFTDVGQRIYVHDARSHDAVLAALQLAAQKWGRFRVRGPEAIKDRCAKLAAMHGFQITNPELQDRIRKARLAASSRSGGDTRGPVPRPTRTPAPRSNTGGQGLGD